MQLNFVLPLLITIFFISLQLGLQPGLDTPVMAALYPYIQGGSAKLALEEGKLFY